MFRKLWLLASIFTIQQVIAAHHPAYTPDDQSSTSSSLTVAAVSRYTEEKPVAAPSAACCSSFFGSFCGKAAAQAAFEAEYIDIIDPKFSVMPTPWKSRGDVFNNATALKHLLAKSKFTQRLPVINRTSQTVSLLVNGRDNAHENISLSFNIATHKFIFLDLASYDLIQLKEGSFGHLNIFSQNSTILLSIEMEQPLLFPRPLAPFNFIPDTAAALARSLGIDAKTKTKIEQYSGHVGYLRHILCRDEKINPDDLYLQRQRLYNLNKLEALFRSSLPSMPRIEQNLFSVWLTNPSSPIEPQDQYIDLALKSSAINPPSDGWNHYFVVQDTALFPSTKKRLAATAVQLISYQELLGQLELQTEFEQAMEECRFAMASDILRVELIKKRGGAYLDIDLITLQSLKPLFYMYDSLFGIEPMSEFVGNAFMAAHQGHPIMSEMIRLIKRNFALKNSLDKSFYSSAALDDGFNTIVQTGPGVSTVAFYNAAGSSGRRDILMPPEIFYPAESLVRPEFRIPELGSHIDLTSATLHLWRTTWAGATGKKNGCRG